VLIGVGGVLLATPTQLSYTGTPADIIKVRITNAGRPDSIPAVIHDLNLPADHRPVRVDVIGRPTVAIDPSSVLKVDIRRPQWEYKQVKIQNPDDASSILAGEGLQGWEATGVALPSSGGATLILKRIK
jgi:hypothetical protein